MKHPQTIRSISILIILFVVGSAGGFAIADTASDKDLERQYVKACVNEWYRKRTPYVKAQAAFHIQMEIRNECRRLTRRRLSEMAGRRQKIEVDSEAFVAAVQPGSVSPKE